MCRRVIGHDADAADAAQEAMIAIVRGLPRFDGRSSFSTWTYRIATNASLDELRRRQRRPLSHLAQKDSDNLKHGEIADPQSTTRIDAIGDHMMIDTALAALPEDFRIAVVLRDVGDLDYAEIAEVLDVPVGTVKSRIARGRAVLAANLGQDSRNQSNPPQRPTTAP